MSVRTRTQARNVRVGDVLHTATAANAHEHDYLVRRIRRDTSDRIHLTITDLNHHTAVLSCDIAHALVLTNR